MPPAEQPVLNRRGSGSLDLELGEDGDEDVRFTHTGTFNIGADLGLKESGVVSLRKQRRARKSRSKRHGSSTGVVEEEVSSSDGEGTTKKSEVRVRLGPGLLFGSSPPIVHNAVALCRHVPAVVSCVRRLLWCCCCVCLA